MSELEIFQFPETGQPVRTIVIDGEPHFVGKDACDELGISKYRDALAQLDADERVSATVDTLGGPQQMVLVSEAGLYALMLISRSPKVHAFRRWITHDVLPAIRSTGRYDVVSFGDPLDELEASNVRMTKAIEIARSERAARAVAEEKVKELEPKAANYDIFLSTDGTQRMDIVAKEFGMSGVKLFAILRDEGVLMEGGRRQNVPYARHAKHFKVVAQTFETNTRGTQSTSTTYVRPSGYDLIRQVLDRRTRRQEVEAFHQRQLGEAS